MIVRKNALCNSQRNKAFVTSLEGTLGTNAEAHNWS